MRSGALVILLTLLAGCAAGPCPEGQARDNAGTCVAIAPARPANVFDQFDGQPPAPTKAEYVADHEAADEFNRRQREWRAEQQARSDAWWAERAADRRTDRMVDAQRETQRKLDAISDKLD